MNRLQLTKDQDYYEKDFHCCCVTWTVMVSKRLYDHTVQIAEEARKQLTKVIPLSSSMHGGSGREVAPETEAAALVAKVQPLQPGIGV